MTDYPKMDAEIKARWVKALRSGEYVQTVRSLWLLKADPDAPAGNCCLGVLGRIAELETADLRNGRGFVFQGEKAFGFLPEGFTAAINLSDEIQMLLARKNDNGATFPEIADWIEQNL